MYVVDVGTMRPPGAAPLDDLVLQRALGNNGTRLAALVGDETIGFVEVDTNLVAGGRLSRLRTWADVGNLSVREDHRRRGVATWLVSHAADWLRLGGVTRLLAYATPDAHDEIGLLRHLGFVELTRTQRPWEHQVG